ncbi:MAG: pyridine nucleotide transhydrogenase [Cyanobacteriota bacterium]|nr:pyridine nucleotide transhydrogenase [Cyanobacteriota bacterium]
MTRGIIGYTGFVGGNLMRQSTFEKCYNSKNIESIAGEKLDLLVCAGAPAVKWLANKEPDRDKASLDRLMRSLSQVKADKCVLVSTVDVYPTPIDVDETTPIDTENLHPYGKHRLELESFVGDRFDCAIVRLPALFGEGLKKNIIYDFLHQNQVEKIHCDHVFQFYNLEYLWQDIQQVLANNLHLVNFATEPIAVGDIAREAFGFEFTNRPHNKPIRYDMKTRYGDRLGKGASSYLYERSCILQDLNEFVKTQSQKPT